ncbi:MAG: hypothetical protein ACK4RK_09815 [Gemmataceae bacterium]
MYRMTGVGLFLIGLSLLHVNSLTAQVRVTPKFAKGGEAQGEAWAEVPDTFQNLPEMKEEMVQWFERHLPVEKR